MASLLITLVSTHRLEVKTGTVLLRGGGGPAKGDSNCAALEANLLLKVSLDRQYFVSNCIILATSCPECTGAPVSANYRGGGGWQTEKLIYLAEGTEKLWDFVSTLMNIRF